ncbi:transcriptional regulator GcvA [Alcaligenes endophyticus]|uniref:Transcriptional regulator GcvA n=1 Tax=Alcaligenes endophyticus TaxID=1929088 RepID=A0ABT8EJU6_9BURK|nr:transcriptional regulator GcvA [Alcaligenes endophyticus]MCX5591871.1 transcriptional regulator GcvA [Alcaligenes endophyticus]MDN4121561.1 transcriptional regulator GcvA [Alcaligenes endophyticus]
MRQLPPLKAIQAFESASRLGSFAEAAAELYLTPSAISHQIRDLEERLQITLFHRVHRGVILTDAGRRYAEAITQALGQIDSATRNIVRHGKSDILTIHCVPSLATQWLMPRLARFSAQYPDIDVRLNASVTNVSLVAEEADFAIRYGTVFPESGVVLKPFPKEPLAVLCAPSLQSGPHPIHNPEDLVHQTLIHSEVNLILWRDWQHAHPNVPIDLKRGPRFDRSFMSISAAADGLGVTLESRLLVEQEINSGRLIMPLGTYEPTTVFHQLLFLQSKANLPKMAAFQDWLYQQLDDTFSTLEQTRTNGIRL